MTYTNPADQTPLAVAPAAWANIINADIRHLRALLPDAVTPGTVLLAVTTTTASFGQLNNIAFNDDAVNARVLATDSVTADAIAAGAVGPAEIAAGAVEIGKLDATVGPTADNDVLTYDSSTGKFQWQATGVPSGLIAAFASEGAIAPGWTRFTNGDGRLLVGAGTTFGQTFVEGASAGASWAHGHAAGTLATAAAAGGGAVQSGGASSADANDHTHAVTGNTADASWIPPSFAVVWAQKS